jgi:hypothetical protein
MTTNPHGLPGHLSRSILTWASDVLDDFDASESQRRLIIAAAEAWDRAAQARRAIARDGAYVTDRYGSPKAHPAIAVERDSRAAFARILAQLGLDAVEEDEPQAPTRNARGHFSRPARRGYSPATPIEER